MKTNDTIIETKRTILRQYNDDDVDIVYRLGSDPEINRYTGDVAIVDHKQAKEIIDKTYKTDYNIHGYGRWAVVLKEEQKVIGFAGLKYLPEVDLTDIGYRFLPEYWGKGLATEVSREIIKFGFEKMSLKEIIGITYSDNVASYKVLEKIGLKFYKTDQYLNDGGNHKWYKIKSEDYDLMNSR